MLNSKKIPPHATKVFSGQIFDVYQWPQKLYDGTEATFECLYRRNTVSVIPIMNDQVIFAEQEQPGKAPYVSFFGGRQEGDEPPLETAKRELLEETGLISDDWTEILSTQITSKLDWTIFTYVAKNCRKVAEPSLDGGEKIQIKACPLEDVLETVINHPKFSDKEIYQRIYSAQNVEQVKWFMNQLKSK